MLQRIVLGDVRLEESCRMVVLRLCGFAPLDAKILPNASVESEFWVGALNAFDGVVERQVGSQDGQPQGSVEWLTLGYMLVNQA